MMYTLQTASEIAMMNKELIMKYAEDPAGNRKLEAMDHVTIDGGFSHSYVEEPKGNYGEINHDESFSVTPSF